MGVVGVLFVLGLTLLSGGSSSDVGQVLSDIASQQTSTSQTQTIDPNDTYAGFASKVVGTGNTLWRPIVQNAGAQYRDPRLVLFRNSTDSGCGGASSDEGPHYCPVDDTIYLDETFFDELTSRFGAKGGDVAEAYVIAHEMGHHVQNVLGVSSYVQQQMLEDSADANSYSVALELQADCYAGVWAHSVSGILSPGEIDEAVNAAQAVGDDRIQKSVGQKVNQESWTHGSSADRTKWFNIGYESGQPQGCSTI
jgi:uncharacterized protein